MRLGVWSFRAISCVMLLAGVSLADPVTYDVMVTPGDGTITGFIVWDSMVAGPTLSNATSFSFTYVPGSAPGITLTESDTIFTDSTFLTGTFGVTDLVPAAGHNWLVCDFGPITTHISLEDFGWSRQGDDAQIIVPSDWKLALRAESVPEPSTLILFGTAGAFLIWRRRRLAPD